MGLRFSDKMTSRMQVAKGWESHSTGFCYHICSPQHFYDESLSRSRWEDDTVINLRETGCKDTNWSK